VRETPKAILVSRIDRGIIGAENAFDEDVLAYQHTDGGDDTGGGKI